MTVSFKRFYQQNKDKIFNYLMRMTGNYDLSRDLMQESFTRCLERYGSEVQSLPLLFTIARNAALDHLRKNRPTVSVDDPPPGENPGHQENMSIVRDEYRRVLSALQKLKTQERDIITLVVSSNLNYREIAAIVGGSESNLKVRIHRIRIKLKNILQAGEV